jgi:hypothetical protein
MTARTNNGEEQTTARANAGILRYAQNDKQKGLRQNDGFRGLRQNDDAGSYARMTTT